MLKKTHPEVNRWVSLKNDEFKARMTPLTEYTKKGVLYQAQFYIANEGTGNEVIGSAFGTSVLHELKVKEINTEQNLTGTYPGIYYKIEQGKIRHEFRKKYLIEKISYDMDMEEGIVYIFLENIFEKSKLGKGTVNLSPNEFSDELLSLNKVAEKGIRYYKEFLLDIESKIAQDKKRTLSSLIEILTESFSELKVNLNDTLAAFEESRTKA